MSIGPQVWQAKRAHLRRQFDGWLYAIVETRRARVSATADVHVPKAALALRASMPSNSAASAAPSQQLLHSANRSSLLLKYFNAWFKFANVSQWSRDLHEEHDFARLKNAWAGWAAACARRRPHPPLSPNSAAAAGVTSLMPRSQQRASRSQPHAVPSDVILSIESIDSPPPSSSVSNRKRPDSRHLVSPDDSARLMFFFGP
jgi:hypothetical protein